MHYKNEEAITVNIPIDRFEGVYTIGTMARKLNVSAQTIRLYEKEGLVLPQKTRSGHRMYSVHDFERLSCIRQMITEHGLNIQGIKKLMALLPCWEYRGGLDDSCQSCPVYSEMIGPCWSLKKVGAKCQTVSCRECPVYRLTVDCHSLKQIIYGRKTGNFSSHGESITTLDKA